MDCGEITDQGSRCPPCQERRDAKRNARTRPRTEAQKIRERTMYPPAWHRLSRQARRMQPFCTDCGARQDLTADHTPQAIIRLDAGLPLRLADVEVVCRRCNGKRGKARDRRPK